MPDVTARMFPDVRMHGLVNPGVWAGWIGNVDQSHNGQLN